MKVFGFIIGVIGIVSLAGCSSVKPWQKMYLNDECMKLSNHKLSSFETSFESYREGASGANNGAVGGGCGCN